MKNANLINPIFLNKQLLSCSLSLLVKEINVCIQHRGQSNFLIKLFDPFVSKNQQDPHPSWHIKYKINPILGLTLHVRSEPSYGITHIYLVIAAQWKLLPQNNKTVFWQTR